MGGDEFDQNCLRGAHRRTSAKWTFRFFTRAKRKATTRMQAVGIGCVWFARRADGDDDDIDLADFIPSSHVADIRQALEGLDSVTNLRIEGNENSLTGIAGLDDDTEDQTFFPMFGSLVIHFDLLVPLRAHEKYLGADGQRRKSKPSMSGSCTKARCLSPMSTTRWL